MKSSAAFFPKPRKAIAGRLSCHQLVPELALQFVKPPMHGGLAKTKRLSGRDRAVVTSHGQKIFEVIPVEHLRIMQFCGPFLQCCGSRFRPPPCSFCAAMPRSGG